MNEFNKTKILPPYLVVASMLLMFVLDRFVPVYEWSGFRIYGYGLMLLAFLCILYCAYLFHHNNTEIKPLEESTFLILSWPYTVSRNPIYICMILFLLGWNMWLQSLSAVLVVFAFAGWIHYRFVLQEEQMLEVSFGGDYLSYKEKTRRWL